MSWTNVKLIFFRELRDQMRDRRTLFTIAILPLLLYPLLAMSLLQAQQFLKEHASRIRIVGIAALPKEPPLLDEKEFNSEFCPKHESRLLQIDETIADSPSLAEVREAAERDIHAGLIDAVIYLPADFGQRITNLRRAQASDVDEVPQPAMFYDTASDKSLVAADRVELVLRRWREAVVVQNLKQRDLPATTARPFEVVNTDVAEEVRRRAAIWSKILPFVLMVWALTGAFYPAIDLCAGEKERGTLETLLSSPAQRSEIVVGKLLTVMTFSMATAMLNLLVMTGLGTFMVMQIEKMSPPGSQFNIGTPPLAAVGWLLLALVPISALFSALSLAVAAFARSSKEGQYYLMPLMMISLPLMMLPLLPAAELDLGFSLIPLTGLMLLLRALIEGQYLEVLRYALPVIGVTAVSCYLAIRWAVHQFNDESVLFRESERFDLQLWVRHLIRDRQDMPTVGEALLCGVLLLVLRFFASLMAPMPKSWDQLVTSTLILQIALIATPACLMAIMLTRRPLKTLLLTRPSFAMTIPAAALLAMVLHPAMFWLTEAIRYVYPINPSTLEQLQPLEAMFQSARLWQLILLLALVPAICEELAFRGFILSGLRRMGHKWAAIALCSVLFGLAHGILQQSLAAAAVAVVIGYVAVKTGSLWPGVAYHFVHNGLTALRSRMDLELIDTTSPLRLLFATAETGEAVYSVPATAFGLVCGIGILWWIKSLPYHRSAEEKLQEALDHQPSLAMKASEA